MPAIGHKQAIELLRTEHHELIVHGTADGRILQTSGRNTVNGFTQRVRSNSAKEVISQCHVTSNKGQYIAIMELGK